MMILRTHDCYQYHKKILHTSVSANTTCRSVIQTEFASVWSRRIFFRESRLLFSTATKACGAYCALRAWRSVKLSAHPYVTDVHIHHGGRVINTTVST